MQADKLVKTSKQRLNGKKKKKFLVIMMGKVRLRLEKKKLNKRIIKKRKKK